MNHAIDLAFVYRGKQSQAEHDLIEPSLPKVPVKDLEANDPAKSLNVFVLRVKLTPVGDYLRC